MAFLVGLAVNVQAQDLHNSLFYMNPLHINPAFSGAYEGTFRLGGIYRDQARTVVKNAYSTPSFYIDAPVVMIGKRHWIGVGGLMFQDQSGTGQLRTSSFQLSGAFHLALDKKSSNVLTLGVQWGRVTRTIRNTAGFEFGDFLAKRQVQAANPLTEDTVFDPMSINPEKGFSDVNAGMLFTSKVSKTTNYNIGFSTGHITRPRNEYNFSGSPVRLPMRLTAHGQLNTDMNTKWTLNPELYFSRVGPATQIQLHAWTGYKIKPQDNIKLNFGLGYRVGDAGQVLFGIDYGDIKAALAYDITLSQLSEANSYQGGFEIAVFYIGKVYKKPTVKPVIIGPHL